MESLYLLIPLSIVLVFVIAVIFWWSVRSGQFDDLDTGMFFMRVAFAMEGSVEAFRAAITKGIENAEIVESLLRNDDCWEIITPAQLGIITFRYRADGLDESVLNELNNHIAQDIIYSGYAMLSPTILGGKHVLRMCTINPRTTYDDLKQTVGMLKSFGEHIKVKPIP